MRRWALVGFLVCGCAPQFPSPMTAAQLVQYNSGPALVAYLAQSDASPTVCDLHALSPHVPRMTADLRAALVDGMVEGKINPVLWRRCAEVLLERLPRDEIPPLFDELERAYRKILADSDLERNPSLAGRLATLHRFYLERPAGLDGNPSVRETLSEEIRTALAKGKLGPVAAHFGQELVATFDVESGRWQGRAVDAAMMDELAASGNEMTLTRFVERLPSPELREQAQRRIVRVHIALSPFHEVRDAAAAVEETVIREGHNRVALGKHPLLSASLDARKTLVRGVLVRQRVWDRTATLLGSAAGRSNLSVLPELSFRGALWAKLQSMSRPVSLCGHKRDLDPSPCIAVEDVTVDNPVAYRDREGDFHFKDHVDLSEVMALAKNKNFVLPVRIGGRAAVSLDWGLSYEPTDDLAFNETVSGRAGPRLKVRAELPTATRFVFSVSAPQGTYAVVVDESNLHDFHIASRGAAGSPGATGSSGSPGAAGSECSDGEQGGDGGAGENGGPGGDGGEVVVELACGGASCLDTVALLRGIILSIGGPGGAGGSGGAGGLGGPGGSSRSPSTHVNSYGESVTDDQGCSGGGNGRPGSNGANGSPGRPGRPGKVTFKLVPPEGT
jgi:hypothetical protein